MGLCIHKYTQWTDPYKRTIHHSIEGKPAGSSDELMQRKNCVYCNKFKYRKVNW